MIVGEAALLPSFNPFALYETPGQGAFTTVFPGFSDTSGKSLVSAPIVPGQKTGVFVAIGQSQIANFNGALYTPVSPLVHNLDPYSGNCYRLAGAVLGCSGSGGGNYVGRIGDKLIAAGTFARVIFINVAIGGSTAYDWSPAGQQNHRLLAALALAQHNGYPVSGIVCDQGTSDNQLATLQKDYEPRLRAVITSARGVGFAGPFFVARHTMFNNVVSAAIRQGQSNVIAAAPNAFAGPDLDTLTGPSNLSDGHHFTDAGCESAAEMWKSTLIAYGY